MFKPARKYGAGLNSYDALKLLALATMVVDHLGVYIWPDAQWLRAIGRMAFPLFLFLVGYSGSWKIRADLLIWGTLVCLVAALTFHAVIPLNVLFTIAITRLAMDWLAKHIKSENGWWGAFCVLLIWFPLMLWFDYSTLAILFAIAGYLKREHPDDQNTTLFLSATIAVHFMLQYVIFRFNLPATLIMLLVAGLLWIIMQRFTLKPCALSDRPVLQWIARNTLPLYALHLMALMLLERLLFAQRLTQFHWL